MSVSEMMMLDEELNKLRTERDAAREGMKQLLAEKIELRDELSSLCEEIRILKEENDELKEVSGILNREILKENSELHRINSGLQEEVTRCGAALSSKKEHANIHLGGKGELHGIDGYGPFNLKQVDKDRWEIWMLHEKVTLYNKKGHRVRGDHNYEGDW
jgi:chromosome segregation ATPase